MVHLSDIQDPPSGSSSASAPQSAHTHAFPTPPPSPPLGSASASTSTSTCPKSQPMYNDPPDLPLPPPGLPPAPPSPPTLIQLANSLSKLPPESYTSRRRLLHLATTSGRALRGAVVTWDDPAGGALVCLAWLALCLSARPLLVLAPHMTAMSVLVANYPGTHATAQRGAATRRQVKVQRAAPGPRVTVALDADHDIAWSTTLADLSSVSRTLGRARALASTPVALAAWTDPDASLAALWLVVSTFPLWIGLHLALPVHHAVGVAGLAPLCAGLVPKVLKSLPDAPLGNASVPGEWRPHEHEHKMWIGFGVGVYVTRYRVYRLGQGYGALLETETENVSGGVRSEWRARHAIELPAAGDLGVRSGWLRRQCTAGQEDGVTRFVDGVMARVGEDQVGQTLEVRWEWESIEGEGEGETDVWQPVEEWEPVKVPGQGLVASIMARVERRRYVRQAVCWVNVPVRQQKAANAKE